MRGMGIQVDEVVASEATGETERREGVEGAEEEAIEMPDMVHPCTSIHIEMQYQQSRKSKVAHHFCTSTIIFYEKRCCESLVSFGNPLPINQVSSGMNVLRYHKFMATAKSRVGLCPAIPLRDTGRA